MATTFFKPTFRNLWKNKTYSFLNIFGLATGIACAALIFLWVEDGPCGVHRRAPGKGNWHTQSAGRKRKRAYLFTLNKLFSVVGVACLVSFPLAGWMMHNWLQQYNYRVNISWEVFLLAGVAAVVIAFITISFQTINAALANPVKSLRSE